MVRINEFGEIVRDGSPQAGRPRPRQSSGSQPPPPADSPGPVWRSVVLGAVLFALVGGLTGYGAGNRWFATELPESGKWHKGVKSFAHAVHVGSWSAHPVHHRIQDVSIPLRIVVVVAAGFGLLIAAYSDGSPGGEGEGFGVLVFLVGIILVVTALVGAVFRLLVWLLAYPVTWFVNDISSPIAGMLLVGFVWGVIGALLGLIVGGFLAFQESH